MGNSYNNAPYGLPPANAQYGLPGAGNFSGGPNQQQGTYGNYGGYGGYSQDNAQPSTLEVGPPPGPPPAHYKS